MELLNPNLLTTLNMKHMIDIRVLHDLYTLFIYAAYL